MRSIITVITLGLLLSGAGTSEADVKCTGSDPDCIWKIVQDCVKQNPGQCAAVDKTNKFAILKDVKGSIHYLTIPTDKITGIEDPAVKKTDFPNYWLYAWEAAGKYVKKPPEWMGLAINSVAGRGQNQMHIHATCVSAKVKAELEKHSDEIKGSWAEHPFLTLQKHKYNAMRIGKDDLAKKSPFQILLEIPAAAKHMEKQTLAVIGYKDGFYILNDYTQPTHAGHAEELLDEDCSLK